MLLLTCFLLLSSAVLTVSGQISQPLLLNDQSEYYVSYEYGENNDITIYLEAKVVAWLGFGWHCCGETGMHNADIVVATFDGSGVVTVGDYFAASTGRPNLDTDIGGTNDILDFGGSQNATHSSFWFRRNLQTGTAYDRQIISGLMNCVWAHGNTNTFGYHGNHRGDMQIDFSTACIQYKELTLGIYVKPVDGQPHTQIGTATAIYDGNVISVDDITITDPSLQILRGQFYCGETPINAGRGLPSPGTIYSGAFSTIPGFVTPTLTCDLTYYLSMRIMIRGGSYPNPTAAWLAPFGFDGTTDEGANYDLFAHKNGVGFSREICCLNPPATPTPSPTPAPPPAPPPP